MILLLYYLLTLPLTFRTLNNVFASQMIDFAYYLKAGSDLLHGIDPYPGLLYPPASLFIFAPLSILPFPVAKIIWTVASLIAFFIGIYIFSSKLPVSKLLNLKISKINLSLILFLFFLQTFPVKFSLAQGQINFFVFLGFALLYRWLEDDRDNLSGFTLALFTILKFNPVFFVVYFIILGKSKSVYSFLFTFITLNLLIDLFSPLNLNISFVHTLTFMSNNYSGYYYNQSLAALFSRLIPSVINAHLLTNVFSLLLWGSTISRLNLFQKHTNISFDLFLVTILLTSPLTWQHHLILTIPAFIFLLTASIKHKSLPLISGTAITFLLININLKHPQVLSSQNPLYSHATFGLLLLYGLLLGYPLFFSSPEDE